MFLAAMLVPVSSKLQLVLGWGETEACYFWKTERDVPHAAELRMGDAPEYVYIV